MKYTSRYPGVKPFETEEQHIFFGRDADIRSLYDLVGVEKTVLLYSKSGLGKSSVINAGLIPRLKADKRISFNPITIRLNVYTGVDKISAKEKIIDLLKNSTTGSLMKNFPGLHENSLSFWLKSMQFDDPGKTHVLIFDQFEELFTYPDVQIEELKKDLHEILYLKTSAHFRENIMLIAESEPEAFTDEQLNMLTSAVNIRMLFAIRSDKLSLLNRLTDYLPNLQRTFLELDPLIPEEAINAITKPAATEGEFPCPKFEFDPGAVEKIIDALSDHGKHAIETFQLQLVCQYAENLVLKNRSKHTIYPGDLGDIKDIHQSFYNNLMAELKTESEEEKIRLHILLEEKFIYEPEKRRLPVLKGMVLNYISERTLSALEQTHLVRSEPYQDSFTYELSHDTLVEPILKTYHKRKEEEDRKSEEEKKEANRREEEEKRNAELKAYQARVHRQRIFIAIVSIAALISIGSAIFGYRKMTDAEEARDAIEIEKTKADAALNLAEKILAQLYFYDDKFALALKQDFGGFLYGFIDKSGNTVIEFKYTEAYPFNYITGYARVKRDNSYFLLDTNKNEYRLCEDIDLLKKSIEIGDYSFEALDLSLKGLTVISKIIFESSQLKILLLSDNFIYSLPSEIGNLQNLASFNLSGNYLSNLPAEIGNLQNLTELSLHHNWLKTLPSEIGNLQNLTSFDLSDNYLSNLPAEIGNLQNLSALDLESNELTTLPPEIGNLQNLTELYLSYNQLATLPPEIGNLQNLSSLDLESNELTTLPLEIGNLQNLTLLILYYNQLTTLPTEIGNLQNLTSLELSNNQLNTLPSEIGNLKNLTSLSLRYNKLTTLPSGIGNLQNLTSLELSNNQLNTLPSEIGNLKNLTKLQLVNNAFILLPSVICELRNLTSLNLGGNQLTTLPLEIGNLQNLTELYLSNNQLTTLPPEIGNIQNLTSLDLGSNQLTTLPSEIGNIQNLTSLDLGENQLNTLPSEIWELRNLTSLNLEGNQRTTLPSEIGKLQNLTLLNLEVNQLTTLPSEIGNLQNLTLLSLGENQFTTLPSEIGNLQNLTSLYLYHNELTTLPSEIGNLQNLTLLNLEDNQLTTLPSEIGNLQNLTLLYLILNRLTTLPSEIGQLQNLTELYLIGNPISEAEQRRIQELLPNCKIYWE